jgi:predicted ATPase
MSGRGAISKACWTNMSSQRIGRTSSVFQVDLRVSARTFPAPVLWLLGFPDQAMRAAEAAIEAARAANHAMSLCHALVFGACPTALLAGDLASGEHYASLLIDHSAKHGLARWHAYGYRYHGALVIKRGDIAAGLKLLRAGFDELGDFSTLRFMDFLVPEALCRAGEIAEGLATVDEAIARSEETEEHRLNAELRIKGELLLLQGEPGAPAMAEGLFRRALDWARRQETLSWELRSATSLTRLLSDQGRSAEALALLRSVYDRFTEGFATADLRAAKALLDDLS